MSGILNSNLETLSDSGIRFLEPEDAAVLMRIRHRAIRECAANFGTPQSVELAKKLKDYRHQLTRYRNFGHAAMLGYWRDEMLTGISGIRLRKYRGREMGLIYSTFVEVPFRGQGFGEGLVEASRQQIAWRWGLRHCFMNVEVHNESALRLYQRCGFEITDKEDRVFRIDGVDHDVYVLEWKA